MIAVVLAGVRLLLAATFAAAALGKLRDRVAFRTTLAEFGAPRATTTFAASTIPAAELATAVLLLPASTARGAALACATLLGLFSAAVAMNLARGRTPGCACFGSATSEPIGRATLVRNVALIVMALAVTFGEALAIGRLPDVWRASTTEARTLGALALVLLCVLAALAIESMRLRTRHARLAAHAASLEEQLRAQRAPASASDLDPGGLPIGAPAPTFDLPRLEGDRASLGSLIGSGRRVALLFMSAHCPACQELWPDVERWQHADAPYAVIATICSGSDQAIEMKVMGHQVINVLLEGDTKTADHYAIGLKPAAVIVGPTGMIESRSVAGVGAIRQLIGTSLNL